MFYIKMRIYFKKFQELTNIEFYQIFKLRFDVFVIEQNCIYNEFDNIDYEASHIFIEENGEVIAYTRAYHKTKSIDSLGRVVVSPKYRKKQLGRKIVQVSIDYMQKEWQSQEIIISAQYHLKEFYSSFGFEQISQVYDDEGIDHIDMILKG